MSSRRAAQANPRVSVILPVCDGGRWLQPAVSSILTQSLASLELLVVDDHSSDGAVAALDRGDPRLHLLQNRSRGVSAAFNSGMAAARGGFIARMDADDIALPERLEQQLAFLESRPDIDICGACVEIFRGDGAALEGGNRRYQAWLNGCRLPEDIRRELFIESPIPNPTAMFRRAALERLGGYADPPWPEDYDLYLRAEALGMRMGKPDGVLLRWREHQDRLTHRDPRYAHERFQAAKAHYLARGRLRQHPQIVIWGAGPGGRLMYDLLKAEGVEPRGFLDVHPRRIGKEKRGRPVWAPDELGNLAGSFIVVAVGAAGARRKIRRYLQDTGRIEGEEFLFAC